MKKENACLAQKFADTVDSTFEYAEIYNVPDEDFRILINNSLCDFLGIDGSDIE